MGNKMKFDVISISSDDDDDIPLKVYRTSSNANDAGTGLKAYSVQPCEFCDEVFLNRYDALIHNAKHIIIPLLKQTVHQCTDCLYYFTSLQELKHHKKLKHDQPTLKVVLTEIPQAIDIECAINKYDMIKKKSNEKLKMKETPPKIKISSKLKFEDDEDGMDCEFENNTAGLLNDLTTECKVNMNLFDAPWVETAGSLEKETKSVSGMSVVSDDKTVVDDEVTASVHFEELLKPGMFRCQHCAESFPTRFNLIQHNMVHIKIRKPRPLLCTFCERFISNNRLLLKKHLYKKHSATIQDIKQRQLQTCKKCGLKYGNYKKHMDNYHTLLFCHLCNEGFESDGERLDHIREHLIETKCSQCDLVSTAIEIQEHQKLSHRVSNVSTIKICDMCCMFVKNKFNMQYVFLENVSELGTRLQCQRCLKMFFELKLVQRLHKKREKEHDGEKEKKKCLTNTDRLKNIRHRLKMINKLSRF